MPGLHEPAPPAAEGRDPVRERRYARYGLVLFWPYLTFYAVYVVLNAFWPTAMDTTLGGVNLAILYGFALIGGALVLALLYGWLCRNRNSGE